MSCRFNILLSLIIGISLVVHRADGKLLSGLFNKGNAACAPPAPLRLPRLPSLTSLLCPQPYASYMNPWSSSYPYSGSLSSGYGMYPSYGGNYAASSYPTYGNSYWNGNNGWTYSPNSWYGSTSQWRNDQRKARDYSPNPTQPPYLQQQQHNQPQQQQQQLQSKRSPFDSSGSGNGDSGNSYTSGGNYPFSRYSYGGKFNSASNKFAPMSSTKGSTSEMIQQQIMQF